MENDKPEYYIEDTEDSQFGDAVVNLLESMGVGRYVRLDMLGNQMKISAVKIEPIQ